MSQQQQQVRVLPRPTMPAMTTAVPGSERSAAVTISSEVLVAAIVFLFMVVVFVFFLYLYARRYLGPNPLLRRARSRLVFASDLGGASAARRGLDPAALAALPVVVVGSRAGKEEEEAMECAVCLCEVGEGEEARLLPKCNHGFHVECIDMWLHSHTTCPLCRSPLGGGGTGFAGLSPSAAAEAPAPEPAEPPVFPTNVLFWGTQDRINAGSSSEPSSSSSSSSRARGHNELVIEIPRRAMDGSPSPISPLPLSRMSAEEMKSPSPAPPSSARLRSLRRLLSRGRQATATGSSCSPRGGGDIEQGTIGGGAATPRTPRTPTS